MSKFCQEFLDSEKEGDDHHICKFYMENASVKIECENCIDQVRDVETGQIYDCKCYDKHIMKKTCTKCEMLKLTIEKIQEEVEEILREEGQKIKKTSTCDEKAFKRIPDLVRKMKHCQRVLLQKSY